MQFANLSGNRLLRSREKLLSAADFIVPSVDHGGEGARRESAFEVL
jgi:hypothetical protein